MPAATQASRSPGIALPVSATMGTRAPCGSAARIARAAARPSITGIWQSMRMSTRSGFAAAASHAFLAIATR